MDHFSYLIDRQHRFLLFGIVLLVLMVVFAQSGETFEPHRGAVSRAEDPKRFWWGIAGYLIAGLFFIGLYLFQNSN